MWASSSTSLNNFQLVILRSTYKLCRLVVVLLSMCNFGSCTLFVFSLLLTRTTCFGLISHRRVHNLCAKETAVNVAMVIVKRNSSFLKKTTCTYEYDKLGRYL
jgi:hypothetical protein